MEDKKFEQENKNSDEIKYELNEDELNGDTAVDNTEDVPEEEEKKDKTKYILLLLILLLFGVIIGGFFYIQHMNKKPSEFEDKVNQISEIDYSKQQDELNQLVEDGMINIQYSMHAEFEGKKSISFNVKNIKNNHYPIVFSIYDENGDKIYQSKKIPLGYEINSIELDKELSKGTHECKISIGYEGEGNVSSTFPLSIVVK